MVCTAAGTGGKDIGRWVLMHLRLPQRMKVEVIVHLRSMIKGDLMHDILRLGSHVSAAGGVSKALARAQEIRCDTIQIFTKNQNRWQQKPTPEKEINRWHELLAASGIAPVISHASYLINLASPKEELWEKSVAAYADELLRADQLDILGVVLHPGSHVGSGEEVGIQRVIDGLNRVLEMTAGLKPLILLETTAGQGTNLGAAFWHLRRMIDGVTAPERVAVCVDTCHIFAAGYELRTAEGYAATMDDFDQTLGIDLIKAIHMNDSIGDLGSRKDRHAHIGHGQIGLDGFRNVVNDPRLQGKPMILETPKSADMHEDVENMAVLRSLLQ